MERHQPECATHGLKSAGAVSSAVLCHPRHPEIPNREPGTSDIGADYRRTPEAVKGILCVAQTGGPPVVPPGPLKLGYSSGSIGIIASAGGAGGAGGPRNSL